jgi:3',5'-cyclic-AMP phosphodiesterase
MIRIALMGDLHYSIIHTDMELRKEADFFYSGFLQRFLDADAQWHVSIGDLTHDGQKEEFQEVYKHIRDSGRTFRQVLGNHDVLHLTNAEIGPLIEQPRYDVVHTEDMMLVFLDTTKELKLHGWGLDSIQWVWLEEQIELSGEKPLILFAHHPVPGTTKFSPDDSMRFEAFQDIRPLLNRKKGLVLYFNGHTHTHSIVSKGNHHFIQTGAVVCDPGYIVVEIDAEQVRIESVRLNDEELSSGRKALFERLPEYHRPDIYSDRDCSVTYTIDKNC